MTHPVRQRQGLAGWAMLEAAKRLDTDLKVAYALLFRRPHLVEDYKRLMWRLFQGKGYVELPDGKKEFSVNGAMVLDIKEQAPLHGELNLNGVPGKESSPGIVCTIRRGFCAR